VVSRLTQSLQQNVLQHVPSGSVNGVEGKVFVQHLARAFFGGRTVAAASKTALLLASGISRSKAGGASPNSIKNYQLRKIPGAGAI
jgi:hypothetical protein